MKLLTNQEVLLRQEILENEEKIVLNLLSQQKKLEAILLKNTKEKKEDKFLKSFQNIDLDIEVPTNLDFLKEPINIEPVIKETKVIQLPHETVTKTGNLFNKLMKIEKTVGKEFAIKYLNGYIEYIKPNNEYDNLQLG